MPQRFLRPGIRNSEKWNSVSWKAQSLWTRLLTVVDDFGRYDGRASVICGECFSVWNELHPDDVVNPQETAALCCEILRSGLAEIYESEGKKVIQLLQWQERARSEKSKWPSPQETAAESCGILRNPASPGPRPSPLVPRPSPERADDPVELPNGFPKNSDDAATHAEFLGCPRHFAEKVWNKAVGRGGRDNKDIPIRSFRHHLQTEWTYEQARTHKTKMAKQGPNI